MFARQRCAERLKVIDSRGRPRILLVGGIAAVLVCGDVAASSAQQLPSGGGPIPPVRRDADGKIEVVLPSARPPAAIASPNGSARPVNPRSGTAPADAAAK